MKQKYKNNTKKRSLLIWGGCAILAAIIIVGALELTHTINLFEKKKPAPSTASQYTKGEQSAGGKNSGSKSSEQGSGDGNTYTETKGQSDEPITNDTADLITPNGNFVSAHKFSLSEAPVLQSSCETTPKVKCQIIFIKGSTTLKLDEKVPDDGGAAYWTWKPGDIGLSAGTWKIQAKASNTNKTLTADDALQLEVTP